MTRLLAALELPEGAIESDAPFSECGLDSAMAVTIAAELEVWLGCALSPTLLWDFPTARALAQHLAPLISGDGGPAQNGGGEIAAQPAWPKTEYQDLALDALSEDELAALLSRKLNAINGHAMAGFDGGHGHRERPC